MNDLTCINNHIHRLTLPYQDIYTTVYIIRTASGVVLFDAASYATDVPERIAPALEELGIDRLDYIFISHNHRDHAGALGALLEQFPDAVIVSRCPRLKALYANYACIAPEDGDTLLDVLRVVTIPGHTQDAAALLDTRTGMLISGDCLQLYGIFGSGKWGANITLIEQHRAAIAKLRTLPIRSIFTAHDYHPLGHSYEGADAVAAALDYCLEPLAQVEKLIRTHAELDDEQVCALYNTSGKLPTLGAHVVTAVRNTIK